MRHIGRLSLQAVSSSSSAFCDSWIGCSIIPVAGKHDPVCVANTFSYSANNSSACSWMRTGAREIKLMSRSWSVPHSQSLATR